MERVDLFFYLFAPLCLSKYPKYSRHIRCVYMQQLTIEILILLLLYFILEGEKKTMREALIMGYYLVAQ